MNTTQRPEPDPENPPGSGNVDFDQRQRPQLHVEYIPPTTDTELLIAQQWQEIFGLDRIGVHDNFFDLGGDSLTFLQAVRQLRDKLGIPLPTKKLLQNPTVHEIAQELQQIWHQ